MRKTALLLAALIIILPAAALARGNQNGNAHNNQHGQSHHGNSSHGSGSGRGGNGGGTPPPTPTPPPTVTPPPVPPVAPPAIGSETRFTAYTTGYGWPDNTPAGGAISNGVIHSTAGGAGTYADPITLAVGHSINNGKDILDYAAGTKFYIPNLRKYFIVEDACGDGNSPQNGPCHTGYRGNVWLDLWVGGAGLSNSATLSCEDTITNTHLVIENPSPSYTVVQGAVFNGSCSPQYGDGVI